MIPRWLGWVWLVSGGLGVAAAVAVGSFGVAFVGSSTQAGLDALGVTRGLLFTVQDTASTVETTVGSVATGLDSLETSIRDGAETLTHVARLADDLGGITSTDIPESLDSLRDTMPQLIGTAGVIDGIMRALSFVGADYDPDAPLDDSLRDLDQRLAVIPDQLRSQASNFSEAATGIADFAAAGIGMAADVEEIRTELSDSQAQLVGYADAVDEAVLVLDRLEQQLESQSGAARIVVILGGLALAGSQTLPLAAGWWVLRSRALPSVG